MGCTVGTKVARWMNASSIPSLTLHATQYVDASFMFMSHSSIIPPGYASTTETANFVIQKLRGRARKTRPRSSDPMGLELISRYDRGNFHVRGYKGNDKMDHCAHIGLLRDILKVHVRRRWRSPRGRKR